MLPYLNSILGVLWTGYMGNQATETESLVQKYFIYLHAPRPVGYCQQQGNVITTHPE